ncbi:LOW QUALITY PROTEIN: ATP synthase mitochondrial F1 complex assembly factor 1 [Cariama cristata]
MAGPLLQAWGLGAALRSRAALRPLGLLAPPCREVAGPGPGSREEALEENPFYGKYRQKIQELRRSSPDVFESRMEKRNEVKKQPVGYSNQGEFIRCMEQKAEGLGTKTSKGRFTKDKTLDSILNIEMVKEKSAEEIRQIGGQYFYKDTVYAVILKKFDLIWKRAQKCPSFLSFRAYALPRKEGYEFFVAWSGKDLHFSLNIQTQGETAPSQLVLYHIPELQEEKVVLMTAEMDSKFLVVHEAQCLANQVQLFYATDRSETYELVETFNHRSSEFKYMSVIAELEQSGLGRELRPGQVSDKS